MTEKPAWGGATTMVPYVVLSGDARLILSENQGNQTMPGNTTGHRDLRVLGYFGVKGGGGGYASRGGNSIGRPQRLQEEGVTAIRVRRSLGASWGLHRLNHDLDLEFMWPGAALLYLGGEESCRT